MGIIFPTIINPQQTFSPARNKPDHSTEGNLNFIFALDLINDMNPKEADEFLDSLEVGLKRGFKIPRKSKDQIEKEKEAKQERIRNEEEAAAKRAAEEITKNKSP